MKNWPKFDNLTDQQKIDLILEHHTNGDYSMGRLAKLTKTYTNRIKREAARLGVKTDGKSDAQKKALRTGVIRHPTEGTERPLETKDKIGATRRASWQSMTEEERKELSEVRKKQYKKQKVVPHLSPNKIINLHEAAKYGSKIENYLYDYLSKFFTCKHQAEGLIGQETYHVDILITQHNIAIEVDGPSHFKAIWSEEKLAKTKAKDEKKNSLLKSAGMTVVRVIADKKFSRAYASELGEKLKQTCDKIIKKKLSNKKVIYVRN